MNTASDKYILGEKFNLCCWDAIGICLCQGPFKVLKRLTDIEDVSFLLSCDGISEVTDEGLIEKYSKQGLSGKLFV